jgi:hypothetical protein
MPSAVRSRTRGQRTATGPMPGHDLALGQMSVAHQPLVAISGQLGGMIAEKGCNFRLHGLRQQRSRAVAQHLGQRVGKRPWLGELDQRVNTMGVRF